MEAIYEKKWSDIGEICPITLYLRMSEYDGVVMETRQPVDILTPGVFSPPHVLVKVVEVVHLSHDNSQNIKPIKFMYFLVRQLYLKQKGAKRSFSFLWVKDNWNSHHLTSPKNDSEPQQADEGLIHWSKLSKGSGLPLLGIISSSTCLT